MSAGPRRLHAGFKSYTICGLGASAARQLMRAYWCRTSGGGRLWRPPCSPGTLPRSRCVLEAAGYVERSKLARAAGDEWWVTTVRRC